jgi:hypothetical protein
LVSQSDIANESGTSYKTAGTNWHFWQTNQQPSTQQKLTDGVVRGIGTAAFGGAVVIAAAPIIIAAAPTVATSVTNTVSPYITSGFNFLTSQGTKQFLKQGTIDLLNKIGSSYVGNGFDMNKVDFFDAANSSFNPLKKYGWVGKIGIEGFNSVFNLDADGFKVNDTKKSTYNMLSGLLKLSVKEIFNSIPEIGKSQTRDNIIDATSTGIKNAVGNLIFGQ